MNSKEYRKEIQKLLELEITKNKKEITNEEKIKLFRDCLIKFEKNLEFDESNKGNTWTDEELRVVLSFSPTRENCLKLAKAFKRGYGSIEQVFRWAASTDTGLKDTDRETDKFVQQVRRVYKELGWRV